MDIISFVIRINTAKDSINDILNNYQDGLLTAEEADQRLKEVARIILMDSRLRKDKSIMGQLDEVKSLAQELKKTVNTPIW